MWGKRRYLWECIKVAWRGSISLANAWAPLLGAAAIWLVLWLLGFEMIVPDRLPGLMVVVAIFCIGAAWLILFFCRLLFLAPYVLHREAQAAATIDKRADIRKRLHQFYIAGEAFLEANLPKNISEEDFKAYEAAANRWWNDSASWILEHLGPPARAKFLDRSSTQWLNYEKRVNESHNAILNTVVNFRKNISTLIETDAYDDVNIH
jgi:hypothetical protein